MGPEGHWTSRRLYVSHMKQVGLFRTALKEGRDQLGDVGMDGMVILKCILEK